MAPIEDFQSRDLAWISDFVMQQVMLMLRPVMEHLQETDAAVDYVNRMTSRLSLDISDVRGDVERTNKYLGILRQGLGVQNEGKCMLQRSLDGTTRIAKRLDDQMQSMLSVVRGVEDSIGQLYADMRGAGTRQEDLAKQVSLSTSALEDLQAKVERVSNDAHSVKDDLQNSEARQEVWLCELRELRRTALGAPPLDKTGRPPPSSQSVRAAGGEPWPQKKTFSSPVDVAGGGERGISMASGVGDPNSNRSGSSQQSKCISRVGSGSGRLQLQQDHLDFGMPATLSSSKAAVWSGVDGAGLPGGDGCLDCAPAEESSAMASRLPLLAARPPGGSRPQPLSSAEEAPRLRFSATMAKPPSRD
mmetsp:Transcript_11599/g.24481  ORF Transcript_11599/g.24481 Transcript_11599/m.24481 type:complete len:360 (+) Transcript_11599:98-1177(+)